MHRAFKMNESEINPKNKWGPTQMLLLLLHVVAPVTGGEPISSDVAVWIETIACVISAVAH